ncbi:MAG TPA: PxKF domain-containing protein, partial [Polyangia bacterium]|nr:PxKF domain-containing protein [Polyangia bacterium]
IGPLGSADSTAPVLMLPGNIVASAVGPSGVAVTYVVSAHDDQDPNPSVTCAPASGTVFALGVTIVTCSATDASRNISSADFTVTVRDTTAPAFGSLPAPIAYATSTSGVAVSYTNPPASDAVDGARPVSCSPASGSTFAPGSTTVFCTARDLQGNGATASFVVKVTYQAPLNGAFFLQPINADGSSVFKFGSTVPVKFALTGASSAITNLLAKTYVAKSSETVTGTFIEATSTSNADSGNVFRYDQSGRQYIFNLATKALSSGTFAIKADLGDGVIHVVNISLKP